MSFRPVGPVRQRLADVAARLSRRLDPQRPTVQVEVDEVTRRATGYAVIVGETVLARIGPGMVRETAPFGAWARRP